MMRHHTHHTSPHLTSQKSKRENPPPPLAARTTYPYMTTESVLPLLYSGVLRKVSASKLKQDHDRYFELRGRCLQYYKSPPCSRSANEKPLGAIDLRDTVIIEADDPKLNYAWTIQGPHMIKPYTLCAGNEEERSEWLAKLHKVVNAAAGATSPFTPPSLSSPSAFSHASPTSAHGRSSPPLSSGRSPLSSPAGRGGSPPGAFDAAAAAVRRGVERGGSSSPSSSPTRLLPKLASLPPILSSLRSPKSSPRKDSNPASSSNERLSNSGTSASNKLGSTDDVMENLIADVRLLPPSKAAGNAAFAASSKTKLGSPRLNRLPSEESSLRASAKYDRQVCDLFATPRPIGLEDFDLLTVVGKGSFGKVMQVRKKDSKEIYAMKCMSKELILREGLVEHMKAEKNILGAINHPYIVKLHFAFQTKESLFLILDFLSGGELFYHLSQVGTFPESRAKFYTAQIGLSLGHLHSLNIIYRDLKPENCVLDRKGNCCITDFGLAKPGINGKEEATTFCGTPEYLAPEFLDPSRCHGKAVDWWSLGILLYEMICGTLPLPLTPLRTHHTTPQVCRPSTAKT